MYGYQGQERVSNSTNDVGGSRWYNFQLRMYNPALGRFNTIDPYNVHYSPYLAMANNPISYVDPDGGRPVDNWQTRAAQQKAKKEFDKWWRDNGKSFRHRGAINLFYHENNLRVFGTSDFDALDLNAKGEDGSVWSAGWGPVMNQVYNVEASMYRDQMEGQSAVAMKEYMMGIASQNFAEENLAWSKTLFEKEVIDVNGDVTYDDNGNVTGYYHVVGTSKGSSMGDKAKIAGDDISADGKIYYNHDIEFQVIEHVENKFIDMPDKYAAEGDFMSDVLFFGGIQNTAYGNAFQYASGVKGGHKVSPKQFLKEGKVGVGLKKVAKAMKITGAAGSVVSMTNASVKFYNINGKASWGQKGQLAVGLTGNGLTIIDNPYTLGFGMTINTIDYYGGFKSSYYELDRIEQTNYKYTNLFFYLNGKGAFFK